MDTPDRSNSRGLPLRHLLELLRIAVLASIAILFFVATGRMLVSALNQAAFNVVNLSGISYFVAIGVPCAVAAARFTWTKLTGVRLRLGLGGPLLSYAILISIISIAEIVLLIGSLFGVADFSDWWVPPSAVHYVGLAMVPLMAAMVWIRRPISRTMNIACNFGWAVLLMPGQLLALACDVRLPTEVMEISDDESTSAVVSIAWGTYFLFSRRVRRVYGVSSSAGEISATESADG